MKITKAATGKTQPKVSAEYLRRNELLAKAIGVEKAIYSVGTS